MSLTKGRIVTLVVRPLSPPQEMVYRRNGERVSELPEEFPPNFMTREWETLSAEEKRIHARNMEVYAAMVEYLDMSIGRLFEYLEANGLYDDTLIVFFSDNGANGAPASAYPGNADGSYLATFDNSESNRGLPNSFIDMGPSWAQASSAPFRLFKSFTSQGGIKSPMIVKTPGSMARAGQWNRAFLHVTDIMPTFLEVAGRGAMSPRVFNRDRVSVLGRKVLRALDRDSVITGWAM